MKDKINKSRVPKISSLYAQVFQVPILKALNESSSAEEVISEYEDVRTRLKIELEKLGIERGLSNRLDKRYRDDLAEVFKGLSGDYEKIINHIESDI